MLSNPANAKCRIAVLCFATHSGRWLANAMQFIALRCTGLLSCRSVPLRC